MRARVKRKLLKINSYPLACDENATAGGDKTGTHHAYIIGTFRGQYGDTRGQKSPVSGAYVSDRYRGNP